MSVREQALGVFSDIIREGAYANLRLEAIPQDDPGRGFIYALSYTALEHLYALDYIIDAYAAGKRVKPLIRDILRLGMAELLYMRTPAHAVCSEYVELTRRKGKKELCGLVNALLRRVDRERDALPPLPADPLKALSIRQSIPEFILASFSKHYQTLYNRIASAEDGLPSDTGKGLSIRSQYPYTGEELKKYLDSNGISYTRGKLSDEVFHLADGGSILSGELYTSGKITAQGESAYLAASALGDMSGKKAMDTCAAPGGKSAAIWSIAHGNVNLTCRDSHAHRVELMRETFSRLHMTADTAIGDAAADEPAFHNVFDAVILDAPCSGLGMLWEKPDLRYRIKEEDIKSLAALQKTMLDTVSNYVKPGGILVYSTCTVSYPENEGQMKDFLSRHPEFSSDRLPFADESQLQLLPLIDLNEGFYIARIRKCI